MTGEGGGVGGGGGGAPTGWDLHDAARQGCIDTCMALMRGGADLHAADPATGNTALHVACIACVSGGGTQHREVAVYLRQAGADTRARNREGHTPMGIVEGHADLRRAFHSSDDRGPLEQGGGGRSRSRANSAQSGSTSRGVSAGGNGVAQPAPSGGGESAYDYLSRAVFPALSPALNEVAAERPEDPIAMLVRLLEASKEMPGAYDTFSTIATYAQGHPGHGTPQSRATDATLHVNTSSLIKRDGLFPSHESETSTPAPSLAALRSYHTDH